MTNENNPIIYWLYFHIKGNGTEWIDYDLPIPSLLEHINKGYMIGWAIDGYFGTSKSQEFLNDIIGRFLIGFREQSIERLPFKPTKEQLDSKTAHIYKKVYRLREFSKQLKSLPTKKHIPERADNFEDFTFWAIKLYAEDMIRASGFIVYDTLETWALSQFENKERSTIRAKCRSIWNWYYERNWELPKKSRKTLKEHLENTMATRKEHILKLNKEKREDNYKKIINTITGLYADTYKKKNGKWNISKIAKELNMHRDTVSKHIKAFEAELQKGAIKE
jgi:hypothetical protein